MDSTKLMTIEEVKNFFSQTSEFKVKQEEKNLRIFYTDKNKTTSTLVWSGYINIQQLIRTISQLVWNHCNNILD